MEAVMKAEEKHLQVFPCMTTSHFLLRMGLKHHVLLWLVDFLDITWVAAVGNKKLDYTDIQWNPAVLFLCSYMVLCPTFTLISRGVVLVLQPRFSLSPSLEPTTAATQSSQMEARCARRRDPCERQSCCCRTELGWELCAVVAACKGGRGEGFF